MLSCFGLARRKQLSAGGGPEANYSPAASGTPHFTPTSPPQQLDAPAACSNLPEAAKAVHSAPAIPPAPAWQEYLADTLPFSVAILTSDAQQVLHRSSGTEQATAQLLDSALQSRECRSAGAKPMSVLASLLGPQLEAEALEALAQGRAWKGTIVGHNPPRGAKGMRALEHQPSNKGSKSVGWVCPSSAASDVAGGSAPAHCAEEAPPLLTGPEEHASSGSHALRSQPCTSRSCDAVLARAQCINGDSPPQSLHVRSRSLPKLRKSSLLMPEKEIERLLTGSAKADECARTRTLLRELSRAQTSEPVSSSLKPTGSSSQGQTSHETDGSGGDAQCGVTNGLVGRRTANTETESTLMYDMEAIGMQADTKALPGFPVAHASSFCEAMCLAGSTRKPVTVGPISSRTVNSDAADVNYSFDVSVSHLKAARGTKEPPIVVLISKSSDLGQAQAMLTVLAEIQLELLSNIMPLHALQFLALESREAIPANIGRLAHRHKDVTLLFMDICGFTNFSKSVEPECVMFLLNNLFSAFDQLTDQCNVHKLETAGDCYLVSGGIVESQTSSGFSTIIHESEAESPAEYTKRVMEFAVKALEAASMVTMPGTQSPVQMRVGIHTGDCVSGLIGSKLPKFSCFGDAMNVASRMESTGVPGRIHISEATYQLLRHEKWAWVPTGGVEVKGKGRMMTYLSSSPRASNESNVAVGPPESAPCNYLKTACTLLKHVESFTASLPLPTGMHIAQASGTIPPIQLGEEEEDGKSWYDDDDDDEQVDFMKELLSTV